MKIYHKSSNNDASDERDVSVSCQAVVKSVCHNGPEELFDKWSVFMIIWGFLKVFSHFSFVQGLSATVIA